MRRRNRNNWILYAIGALFVIGLLYRIGRNPAAWIIPIVIIGGVFLLYKYPPHRWKSMARNARSQQTRSRHGPTAQTPPHRAGKHVNRPQFRVIKGSKTDSDDDLPKYH